MGLKEGKVENYLQQQVIAAGGICRKLTNSTGWPDRLILMPGGATAFCEVKAEDGVVSGAQLIVLERLHALGFIAKVVFCKEDVNRLLQLLQLHNGGE